MKKMVWAIGFFCLLSFVIVQAQTRVTLGVSSFMANYSLTNEDDEDVITTDSGLLFGPYLSIASDRLNLGASMFFGSFPITEWLGEDIEDLGMEEASISRKDLNLSLGYALIRSQGLVISPFIGMKYFTWSSDLAAEGEELSFYRKGTMFGGGLQAVIKPSPTSGFYLYGSGALLGGSITDEVEYTYYSYSANDESSSSTALISLGAGIGYRVPNSGLGINVGFRGDFFGSTETDEEGNVLEEGASWTERVTGLVGTVSWTF